MARDAARSFRRKEENRHREERGREGGEGGEEVKEKRKRRIPVVGESLSCLRSLSLSLSPVRIHELADYVIYSAYFMREPTI